MRTYSELSKLETLEERYEYLALDGEVGNATFGFSRWLNQSFYRSREWKDARTYVISRDDGCDMGVYDYPLAGTPQIHHMNPITMEDIELGTDNLLDPEYLISVSKRTHNAIHFGDKSQLVQVPLARTAGDTRLW